MARTAVVAGTATAVSGAVSGKHQAKAQQQADAAATQQQAAIDQAVDAKVAAQSPPPPAGPPDDDMIAKLQQLATMKQQGLLTDEEFTSMKAKLIAA
ncbi:MAG: SHOCT domain-containing protein [Blastococcus sp.]